MQRLNAAEQMASIVGSWRFIGTQTVVIALWIALNSAPRAPHPDRYPFILLNLLLSLQAAYTGPVLLMAANRQEERDRRAARKAEREIHQALELLEEDRGA